VNGSKKLRNAEDIFEDMEKRGPTPFVFLFLCGKFPPEF
jgi:hypothetical protein